MRSLRAGTNRAKIETKCARVNPQSAASNVSICSLFSEKRTIRLNGRKGTFYELSEIVSNSLLPYVIELLDSVPCFGHVLSTESNYAAMVDFYREKLREPIELHEDHGGIICELR